MTYQLVNEGTKNSMRLQQIGIVQGTPAGEIKKGDFLMWNWGAKSQVTKIVKESEKSIWIEETYDSGKTFQRRFSKTRLVCILQK